MCLWTFPAAFMWPPQRSVTSTYPTSLTAAASVGHAASIKNATRCAVHRVCSPLFRTTDEKKVSTLSAQTKFCKKLFSFYVLGSLFFQFHPQRPPPSQELHYTLGTSLMA